MQRPGSHRSFCSSVPSGRGSTGGRCRWQRPARGRTPTPARGISSAKTTLNRKSDPPPPYSSGTAMPRKPRSPAVVHSSLGGCGAPRGSPRGAAGSRGPRRQARRTRGRAYGRRRTGCGAATCGATIRTTPSRSSVGARGRRFGTESRSGSVRPLHVGSEQPGSLVASEPTRCDGAGHVGGAYPSQRDRRTTTGPPRRRSAPPCPTSSTRATPDNAGAAAPCPLSARPRLLGQLGHRVDDPRGPVTGSARPPRAWRRR